MNCVVDIMPDKKPKVSVIIPTYNRAHILGRAIQSVLDQTYQDFEIIVVDDGSTDNTEEVVKNFNDERIVYHLYGKNRGVAAARNIGIKLSKAEYIAFQDSDDVWYPDKLEKTMKNIKEIKNIDFIFSCGKIIKDGEIVGYTGNHSWINKSPKKELIRKLFMGNFIPTQGVVVKKDKIIQVGGFDESFPSASDHELWLRLIPICNFHFIGEPLFDIHFSEKCITSNVKIRLHSQKRLFNKNKAILKKYVKSKIWYYIIKQIFIGNIFFAAAWDVSNRQNNYLVAMFYYTVSSIAFPIKFIDCLKMLLRGK